MAFLRIQARLLITALFASSLAPVLALAQAPAYQSPGTAKMSALLRRIYETNDWKADPNKPAERAKYYKSLIESGKLTPRDRFTVQQELANEQLRSGDSEAAVLTLQQLRKYLSDNHIDLPPEIERRLTAQLAISWLRLGEQENCLHMHGQKSCVFPIRASGVHQLPRGAEGAVTALTALLEKDSADYESRWLLNVAYMQLGKYPSGVPAKWLIPEKFFDSEYDIHDFPDVAPQAHLAVTGRSGGAILEDFDGDGLLDLMVSSSGPLDQMRFFHNNGDGTFSERTREAGLTGETGGLNLILTDYNNDGHPDVLVLRGAWWNKFGAYPASLLRNNGNGTFDDVTESAGLLSANPTQAAAWADYDNDGWLDLFLPHESTPGDPRPSQLFHNNHDGTFAEVTAQSGIPTDLGFVKGCAWGDFNNDGRPDLYISVKGGRNRLFRNDTAPGGPPRFTDVTAQAGVATQTDSFATWFFDYDNDGWPDIFVAGYRTDSMQDVGAFEMGRPTHAETPRLYHNNHDGTFTDVTAAVHLDRAILVMGANFGDLDNDGWLDIYLGTGESSYEALLPNRMFRNAGGSRFEDVTTSGGFGHLQKGHGIAFADLENNGNEDVFEEMGGALPGDTYQSVLYRNPGHGNHSITLDLEGVQTNRAAFGARICLTVTDHGAKRRIYRTVGYGSSFGGNPLRQHIGIGHATAVDQVEITWPVSKSVQIFRNVTADRMFHIREGDNTLHPVKQKPYTIGETMPVADRMEGMDMSSQHK